jgi:hypothetical protein
VAVEAIEKPLPKPTEEGYVATRLIEALVKAGLALEFLGRGLTRGADGKALRAWNLAALLRLELERLKTLARTEGDRRWLETAAVPGVPTARMLPLAITKTGYKNIVTWTSAALDLRDYQYHGPDQDMALSKFRRREEAAEYVKRLVAEVAERVEALKAETIWTEELDKALEELHNVLKAE